MVSRGELGRARWRKSTRSESAASCVSVALVGKLALIRDTKNPNAEMIALSKKELRDFIYAAKAGKFNL